MKDTPPDTYSYLGVAVVFSHCCKRLCVYGWVYVYVHSKFFLLSVHSQRGHKMRSWQGEKIRVLGVEGLHRVSRSKIQVSPLTQRLYGFRGQEGKIPTKTTKKKLGTNV